MGPGASGGGTKNGRQAFRAAGTEVGLAGPRCLGAGARVPARPSARRRPAEPRASVLGRGGRRCAQVRETGGRRGRLFSGGGHAARFRRLRGASRVRA